MPGETVKFFVVRRKDKTTREQSCPYYLTPQGLWTSWVGRALLLVEFQAEMFELPAEGELVEFTLGDIEESTTYSEVSTDGMATSRVPTGPVNRQQRRRIEAQKRRQKKH